jgi:hypothetical protein
MLNCEARGDYRTMRAHIRYSAADIIEKGDEATVRGLSRLLVRVVSAIDKEAEVGEGSLMNHGHVDNIAWAKGRWLPFKLVSSDHIDPPHE